MEIASARTRDWCAKGAWMTTKLRGVLKREIEIDHAPYVLHIEPNGFRLVPKGRRKGYALKWSSFVNGEAALATALNASLSAGPDRGLEPPDEPEGGQ